MTDAGKDFGQDFDEFLTEQSDQGFEAAWEADEDYQPRGEADVERLLRLVARMDREIATHKAFHKGRVSELDAWLEDRCRGPERSIMWAKRSLEAWARQVHGESEKGRVWDLPGGTLRLTAGRESLVVDDEAEVVAWLEENFPQAVKKAVDKTVLKDEANRGPRQLRHGDDKEHFAAVSNDGEIIPGVHLEVPDRPSFTAKPK